MTLNLGRGSIVVSSDITVWHAKEARPLMDRVQRPHIPRRHAVWL
jgi:hypothetical protein